MYSVWCWHFFIIIIFFAEYLTLHFWILSFLTVFFLHFKKKTALVVLPSTYHECLRRNLVFCETQTHRESILDLLCRKIVTVSCHCDEQKEHSTNFTLFIYHFRLYTRLLYILSLLPLGFIQFAMYLSI